MSVVAAALLRKWVLISLGETLLVDLRLWGKERGLGGARYPLVCHGLDAAAAVRWLWERYLSPRVRAELAAAAGLTDEQMCRVMEFWASTHDIGKVLQRFQEQVEVPEGFPIDPALPYLSHDEASQRWLVGGLSHVRQAEGNKNLRLIAQLLGGHHGSFRDHHEPALRQASAAELELGEGLWEEQRRAHLHAWHRLIDPPALRKRLTRDKAAIAAGIVILADWLVSQTSYVRARLPELPAGGDLDALSAFLTRSREETRSLVDQAGLARLRLRPGTFEEEFGFPEPNALQTSIAAGLPPLLQKPGLLMIAAPTGFGKTEVALHAARLLGEAAGTSGMFVALPTMATSDQMFLRIARYVVRRAETGVAQSLLHGMAWLKPLRETLAQIHAEEEISSDPETQGWGSEWLHGAKRAMLAPVGVGTIDQALLAVLPVRHNSLRLLSLVGKTVVIDEVHAFSQYMLALLRTLLTWLGSWNVPVVLLSATLPRHVATSLAAAYQGKGKGEGDSVPDLHVPYPGWTYIERDGCVESRSVAFPESGRRTLSVELRPVALTTESKPDRLPVLREALAPIVSPDGSGCALVLCTTVAEAQQTYQALRDWLGETDVDLHLVHARYPMHQREAITEELMYSFGKPRQGDDEDAGRRQRPLKAVVVATQVVEQSLDLDFDLVISDMAPIELLLQRAGRLQRHAGWDPQRPAWADVSRGGLRRIVVLTAPGGDLRRFPRSWCYVYPPISLIRAHRLLERHAADGIRIPEDVQTLVDLGNPSELPVIDDLVSDFAEEEIKRAAVSLVERQTAGIVGISPPQDVKNLAELSNDQLDEHKVSTRFNADSERVIPLFRTLDDQLRLGGPHGDPLPTPRDSWLSKDELAAIMRHSIPVPGSVVRGKDERHQLPEAWQEITMLRNLVVLYHEVTDDGSIRPASVGDRKLLLDAELGLRDVE